VTLIKRRLNLHRVGSALDSTGAVRLVSSYRKTGHVKKFRIVADQDGTTRKIAWTPRPGYVYSQVRAISARVNQNYDAWPSKELKQAYHTFVGKPIFVNHTNEDWKTARGVVVAARYVERGADKYIECVMETDAKRFPKLAREIVSGGMDSVSMGVEAGFTICSVCEKKATDVHDMCHHIRDHKGEYFKARKTGKRTQAFEHCYKLAFFELSWVFDPADETAVASRVIAAARHGAEEYKGIGWNRYAPYDKPTSKETDFIWSPQSEAYQDHMPPNSMKRLQWETEHPGRLDQFDALPLEQKFKADPLDFYSPYEVPGDDYKVRDRDTPKGRTSLRAGARRDPKGVGNFEAYWYRLADRWNDTKAPQDIDTLRDESEDDTDDFHHWVESPPELRAPNIDQAKQLDREQESDGLDGDRRAEDAEEFAGQPTANPESPDGQFLDDEQEKDPVMPINPPEIKKGRRTPTQGARMPRYYYAADDDDTDAKNGGGYDDGAPDDGGYEDDDEGGDDSFFGDESEGDAPEGAEPEDDGGGDDIHDLLDEAQEDIEAFENGGGLDDGQDDGSEGFDDGSDEFGDDDASYDDDGGDFGECADDGSGDDYADDGSDDGPPWADEDPNQGGPVRSARSHRNGRGGTMPRQTLASRDTQARHFTADESGHTDGGPYGIDDSQGNQEDVYVSQVPGAEAVCAPTDDTSNISNTPDSLVASRRSEFDPNHYQKMADAVAALPPAQRRAMADQMVRMLTADNKRFNWRTFFEASRVPVVKKGSKFFYAEALDAPDKVDPSLSGTDVQDLKGDEFESLALDNVETQPKDASIHKFQAFDAWLHKATGKTAAQHGNANYIRRAAASYAKAHGQHAEAALQSLFPTLEYVLREARKVEGRNANMQKRAEDMSLEVAAPDGRIDVEAPVKNVTDADAQASQFDLGDFADNASDSKADPVLDVVDGNAGTWAPDKGKDASRKLASGVEAVRLADAYIRAYPNTYSDNDRWKLTARFETLRQPVVRDRIRVLEAVAEDRGKSNRTARKVAVATSRGTNGIPKGLASRGRTAGSRKVSASDPATDYGLFI
jgi:hypothetical protein